MISGIAVETYIYVNRVINRKKIYLVVSYFLKYMVYDN